MLNRLFKKYRYSLILLKELVITDFKLRYQSSVLGYLWSLLRPMAMFTVLYIVFTRFLPVGRDIDHYPAYLLLGIVMWNFFVEITTGSIRSIVDRGELIRKINFPKYVIVLSVSFSALINLILNLIVLSVIMMLNGAQLSPHAILSPILLIELLIFSVGIGFALSTLFVRFRDINYIWEVCMQVGFYLTPIIYGLHQVPPRFGKILLLNPVAQIIQDLRSQLITPKAITIASIYNNSMYRLIPILIVVITAIMSGIYFKRKSKYFAEEI